MKVTKTHWASILVGVAVMGLTAVVVSVAPGQQAAEVAPGSAAPGSTLVTLDRPQLRTPEQAAAMEATRPDPNPSRVASKPFLPTMDFNEYAAQKAAAAAMAAAGGEAVETPVEPGAPPTAGTVNFQGLTKSLSGGLFPPDTDGAVGHTQYAQIVNSRFRVYNKVPIGGALTVLRDQSLAAF